MSRKQKKQSPPSPPAEPEPAPAAISVAGPALLSSGEAEPVATRGVAVPVLLIALLGALLYWGDIYLMANSGGFDPQVYAPFASTNELASFKITGAEDPMAEGAKVYAFICVQCHQDHGKGNPAMFIPPLAGSDWVLEKGPGRIIRIVSKGMAGPVTVSGQQFSGGAMFAAGDQLPGDEEAKAKQVAAVLTYIRNSWGNKADPVTVEQVKKVREKIKDHAEPWTEPELKAVSPDD
jgi:mono/diheme cytochrome c family protein